MAKTVKAQLKCRHDTAANWTAKNPVLLDGELGVETDTTFFKIGDGATAWTSLKYVTSKSAVYDSVGRRIDTSYLPLSGGTMTGQLAFQGIGNTGKSQGLYWGGSTDWAGIYYQTTKSDQGNLVINLGDDDNCYLRLAYNGDFKTYFSPADGAFHGNVIGTADNAKAVPWSGVTGKPGFATVATSGNYNDLSNKPAIPTKTSNLQNDSGYSYLIKNVIDLTDTTKYADDTYWPCVVGIPYTGDRRMMLSVQLNSGSKPSWSTHNAGFTCVLDVVARAGGWGTTDAGSTVLNHVYSWANVDPCSYVQFTKSSNACFYLRGGGKYFIYTDFSASWQIITTSTNLLNSSTYTEMVAPTKTLPAISINRAMIMCNVDGLASKATADANGNNIAGTYATKDYVAQAIKEALAAATITYDGKVTYKG